MSFRGPQGPNRLVGHTLGHYRILEQIGAGGMGVVYRAHDEQLDRDVAIKVLPVGILADEAARKRFRKEALALAKLNHPNVATVHEFGSQDGTDFLVTEYIAGMTLDGKLAAGTLPEKEVIDLGIQLAQGLGAAHEHGIVHRDLKPANLRLTPDGRLKILDFGLAQLIPHPSDVGLTATLTQSQQVTGTLPYMAPEQLRGEPAKARTDIWAAGAVLYEMATAHRPFEEKLPSALAADIIHKSPPSPRRVKPEVSAKLEAIILKCLEKDPAKRYSSARELQSDLERLRTGVTPLAARQRLWLASASGAIVVVMFAVGTFFYLRRSPKLTEKDTIVLADFTNTTGDPVFDGTLRQGLAVQLEQSPFLSLVSEERIQQILRFMTKPPDARITREIAREICERTASAAVLDGSIASLGSHYVITLSTLNCRTGDSLTSEQIETETKEQVLRALGQAASKLRSRLGESLASIQKYDVPIEQATTPSLEALKAFTLGWKQWKRGLDAEAVPFLKRAIELDPNFALAYANLAVVYDSMGNSELESRYAKRAFELRDRASEREKLYISGHYYGEGTGELDKAMEIYQVWRQTYPRDSAAQVNAAELYERIGQFEQAIEPCHEAIRLDPKNWRAYGNLARAYSGLNRLEEAKDIGKQGLTQNRDDFELHWLLYQIAFAQGDTAAMQREVEWARVKPAETNVLWFEAAAAASSGRLQSARELFRRAAESVQRHGDKERGASLMAWEALIEAEFGNYRQARDRAVAALAVAGGRDSSDAALALAFSGDTARAQAIVNEEQKRLPLDTFVNSITVPEIRAANEINRDHPAQAIDLLRAAAPYDLGWGAGLTPIYIRGQAYLRARAGKEAAAEFQKILDHPGVRPISRYHALAHLGVARAWALVGDTAQSRHAYKDFFALWKDADPDIPILKEAKEEYADLR